MTCHVNDMVLMSSLQLLMTNTEVTDQASGQKKIITTGKLIKKKPKPAVKALKSRVACLIFARRMSEVNATRYQQQKRKRGVFQQLGMGFHKFTKFVHRFDALFLASSVIWGGIQVKRFFFNR